jgi:hypothetical protein
MNDRVKKLGDEALKLDLSDRVELVDLILASVQPSPDETHQAWTNAVLDRVRAYERGDFELTDADDVLAHARADLRQ